jgi:uncharacterized YccA/Bax inhibitor family protein
MQSRNPVFNNSKVFKNGGYASFNEAPPATASAAELQEMYSAPTATGIDTGRMTMDDVVVKTGLMFAVLLPLAAFNYWQQNNLLTIGGIVVGLVLGLVVAFKQSTNATLILGYAAAEGLFLGGISKVFEVKWPGIVPQAILGTLAVFVVALFAYKSGRVRVTPAFQRKLLIAMGGYAIFCVINFVVMLSGHGGDFGLRQGPFGFAIGLFAVGLATMMLILDFNFAEQGVRNGLPQRYAWLAAFGLVVTLVWLYIEMLRLLGIVRGNN